MKYLLAWKADVVLLAETLSYSMYELVNIPISHMSTGILAE
jgi:hypothetical protein